MARKKFQRAILRETLERPLPAFAVPNPPEPILPPPLPQRIETAPLLGNENLAEIQPPAWADRELAAAILKRYVSRQNEALRLFEPLPEQLRFLTSRAKTRVYRGGNRAGKTITGAVECALAVTGRQGLHGYYPKENVQVIVVGWDLKACGDPIHKKLFEPGAFKVIRDPDTKAMRAYRPWEPWDAAYAEKAKDAAPLIPKRFVKTVSWENRGLYHPARVELITGSVINYYSSQAHPRAGVVAHLAWLDEEIQNWLTEIQFRLLDLRGKLVWTATAQTGTPELVDLDERAEREHETLQDQETLGLTYQPKVEVFSLSLDDNPHLHSEEKQEVREAVSDAGVQEVRIGGGMLAAGIRVFPEFRPRGDHSITPFVVPDHWTRYFWLDPGRQVCAALLCVVPPPEEPVHGGHVYGIEEIYLRVSDAKMFAAEAQRWFNAGPIERMWIDNQYAQTVGADGRPFGHFYELEMKELGLNCVRTKHRFETAPSDRDAGIDALRKWLKPLAKDGLPKFRIFASSTKGGPLKNLVREMLRFSFLVDPRTKLPTDEIRFGKQHLPDCLRYAAFTDPKYVPPKPRDHSDDYAWKWAQDLLRDMGIRRGQQPGVVMLGPTAP